jgi:hypothetical protein
MKTFNQFRPIEFAPASSGRKVLASTFLPIFLLGAACLLPTRAAAQSATSGAISGVVTDPSGASVPKAQVELVSKDTNASQTQATNASGQYLFSGVRPGQYKITVKMPGFRTSSIPDVTVEVNKSAELNLKLEVGGDNQIVEVVASAEAQLQTVDAQIGNSISKDLISRLPTLQRNVTELMNLQPGVVPTGSNLGARVTGAIDDQNTVTLDGVDVTAVVTASGTSVPTPQDSVEEFRVNVSNPNSDLGRASGGQMTLVGRHGSNTLHGSGYGFFQNSVLNANTWDNNVAGVKKPDISDKRYGGRLGGAIKKNKTFLFGNYEGRDFNQVSQVTRTVPTDTLKAGILRFRDGAGNIVSYNLNNSSQCGPTGDQACDPRGIGMSPSTKAQLALMPASNLNSGGDGLNTLSYLANIATPQQDRYIVTRLDHNFSEKLQFNGSYTYFRHLQVGSGDISLKDLTSVISTPQRGTLATGAFTYQLTPSIVNVARFGFVRDVGPNQATSPTAAAGLLNIPGTSTSAGPIALLIGGGTTAFLDSPIDLDTQRARFQASYSRSYQFNDDITWILGKHTIRAGAEFRPIWYRHDRADKVVGSISSLVATVDQGSFLNIPSSATPPVCASATAANCIKSSDVTNWGRYYAAVLGLVDNVNVLAVRDSSLKPTPFGTNLVNKTWSYATDLNVQDTWRFSKSITFNFGLSWGVQTPPSEDKGQQTVQEDLTTGKLVDPIAYLNAKLSAAKAGQVYNPNFGWLPVNDAHHAVFNTVWNAFSPRAAVAYSPDGSSPFAKIFGDRKTAIRAGFGLIYDRSNLVQNVLIPMLGIGFGQTISINGPTCSASGAGGKNCNAASSNPALSFYRVGVDGSIPLPQVPSVSVPVSPQNLAETLSFQVDPNSKLGKSYNADFSIQRELPGGWIVDAAYVGRFARNLPQAVNLTQAAYMFTDPTSGQSFAQAYDTIRAQLRSGATVASIANQPFFENQFKGIGTSATQYILARQSSNFTNGNVATIFLNMGIYRRSLGMQPFNNDQSQVEFMRTYIGRTNYNGGLFTVSKRLSRGLLVNANYTYSKALDDGVFNQNSAGFYLNSFFPNAEYGPSPFDRRHVFNLNWVYELPSGKGHKLAFNNGFDRALSGWYVSGIATTWTGVPLTVGDSAAGQTWGDATVLGSSSGAIPTGSVSTGLYAPISGAGYNFFSTNKAAITNFRPVLLSADTRSGRANPIYGLPYRNLDLSISKDTMITERFKAKLAADFFNVLNHPNFANPSLNITNPNTFGTINSSYTPPNRTNSARWIQLSVRVEF